MKKSAIIKEANIGSVIEFTNIELTIIRTKWMAIKKAIEDHPKHNEKLSTNVEDFNILMEDITENVLSLDEVHAILFSREENNGSEAINDVMMKANL